MTWFALALMTTVFPVTLEVDPCVGDLTTLERTAALELDEVAGLGSGPPLAVRLWCDGEDVEVDLREGTTVRAHRRFFLRGSRTPATTRLLALAIAELVASARVDVVSPPPAPAPSAPRRPLVAVASSPDTSDGTTLAARPRWAVSIHGEGFTALGSQHLVGVGLRVGLERALSIAAARVELAVEHARELEHRGWLDELLVSTSFGAQLYPWQTRTLAVGASAKFGLARLAGQADANVAGDGVTRVGPFFRGALRERRGETRAGGPAARSTGSAGTSPTTQVLLAEGTPHACAQPIDVRVAPLSTTRPLDYSVAVERSALNGKSNTGGLSFATARRPARPLRPGVRCAQQGLPRRERRSPALQAREAGAARRGRLAVGRGHHHECPGRSQGNGNLICALVAPSTPGNAALSLSRARLVNHTDLDQPVVLYPHAFGVSGLRYQLAATIE